MLERLPFNLIEARWNSYIQKLREYVKGREQDWIPQLKERVKIYLLTTLRIDERILYLDTTRIK